MAENTTIHIGENSPEYVALMMTRQILIDVEGKYLPEITRKEYLETYCECLYVIRHTDLWR